jgi:hypothetical protein
VRNSVEVGCINWQIKDSLLPHKLAAGIIIRDFKSYSKLMLIDQRMPVELNKALIFTIHLVSTAFSIWKQINFYFNK